MPAPAYAVTGFIDSGKTTFLNTMLNMPDWSDARTLVIQFETGETEFVSRQGVCALEVFSPKVLERHPEAAAQRIRELIEEQDPDEIWIEWNGTVPLAKLDSLLASPDLRDACELRKVVHASDAENLGHLLGRTGNALPEQIAGSDLVILRGAGERRAFKRAKRLLRAVNPGVGVYDADSPGGIGRVIGDIFGKDRTPVRNLFITVTLAVIFYSLSKPVLEIYGLPADFIVNVFLGIILQAFPFLLIGVLISSAVQVFVPRSAIERCFPKSTGLGMLAALLGGFCLPVCDCVSIPVFRSLVRKGVPLPAAVTFMTAAPVTNPVVILSTWYAFNGDVSVVAGRVFLGIVSSLVIGTYFALRPRKNHVLAGGDAGRFICACGCCEDPESIPTLGGKADFFIRHARAEFFSVGKYLAAGAFIASLFQISRAEMFRAGQGTGSAAPVLFMMVMAFVLSLCSSSDAVIARSLTRQFPMSAIMGFLVFGPMMDIKNVMMLGAGFSKRFIAELALVTFAVCFAMVLLAYRLGGVWP
ncbi:MAG: permease [Synergistaceae bacterium]|jgi:uncharacterized membrane protein YraQ (UPF0718 family)|nr:permease [Synergistaceae bacterium]